MPGPKGLVLALAGGLLLQHAQAGAVLPQEILCLNALQSIYGSMRFEGEELNLPQYYGPLCNNTLKVTSIYAGLKTLCPPENFDAAVTYIDEYCKRWGKLPLLPMSVVAENLTDDKISRMPRVGRNAAAAVNMTKPVLPVQDWFDLVYRTVDTWNYEQYIHMVYGWASYGFWGGILLFGMAHRLYQVITERQFLQPFHTAYFWVHKNLVMPSVLPPYRRQPLWYNTIPTRMEGIIIAAFWIMSIVLSSVSYRAFKGNTYYHEIAPQVWRYVSDRTGILSYANLPWLWLFAGRNNIFIWATGWQFSTFNVFHRHVARVATLQAVVHSIGYTVFYFISGSAEGFKLSWPEPWWFMGVIATIVMSLLMVFSANWFRQKYYETFLLIHIVFSIMTIIGLFYHTWVFEEKIYDPYLWPLVAIWSFDRFMRLVRTAYCNIHVGLRRGKTLHTTKATVSYDAQTGFLLILANPAAPSLNPGPGQHYFLYQPLRWKGWENHPFTLGFWNGDGAPMPKIPKQVTASEKAAAEGASGPATTTTTTTLMSGSTDSSLAVQDDTATSADPQLGFWVKPCDGWTKALMRECTKAASPRINTTILLEGPYGHAEPLWTYEEILLIAGGSGIAAIVPYVLDHIRRSSSASAGKSGRGTRTRKVTIVWSHRNDRFIREVARKQLAAALEREDVRAVFHSTERQVAVQSGSATTSSEVVGEGSEKSVRKDSGAGGGKGGSGEAVAIVRGRPDIDGLIDDATRSARESDSRVAVLVCGPLKLADDSRAATHRAMKRYGDAVEYYEEAFGW